MRFARLLFFSMLIVLGTATQLHADDRIAVEALPGVKISIEGGRDIFLVYLPKAGEGYLTLAEKFTCSSESWKELKEINADPVMLSGKEYRIPYRLLRDEYKYLAIIILFPQDRLEKGSWLHHPSKSRLETFGEGLWQVSEWFTGAGENFQELMKINRIADPSSISGLEIAIPGNLLLPVFARPQSSDDEELTFSVDPEGDYAGYRLKKGETIYTSVVIRFTGMMEVDDVNELSALIARRSGIRDVKNIAVGQIIKIPVEHLLPEYLPKSDPRRIAFELENYETEKYAIRVITKKLEGVYLVIDAGHGGIDIGAFKNGVWEHDYLYDIMCRIKRKIENETGAVVLPIIEDKKTNFEVFDSKKLVKNKEGHILTHPPFISRSNGDANMAVNLRWYLANSIRRKLIAQRIDEDRIVFVSLHADSLHPALRGAMVYYAGHRYVRERYGNGSSNRYAKFQEVREMPYVTLTQEQKKRSEGLSRSFGKKIASSFREEGLPVHEYIPVRNRIRRHHKEWVPAVLKGNEIPIKILLEVVNLNNKEDARIMKDPAFREKVATAFVKALIDFYGEG